LIGLERLWSSIHIACLFDEFFHILDLGENNRPYFGTQTMPRTSKKKLLVGGGWWVDVGTECQVDRVPSVNECQV